MLDARKTLSKLMSDHGIDGDAFDLAVGDVLRAASMSGRRVRAYGEMVALLWDADDVAGALELESLWNALGVEVAFSLLCAYPAGSILEPQHIDAFHQVCGLHSGIVEANAETGLGQYEETRAFKYGPDAPNAARRFVARTMTEWCIPNIVDDAACVVSELATNAVMHGASDFVVAVSRAERDRADLGTGFERHCGPLNVCRRPWLRTGAASQ